MPSVRLQGQEKFHSKNCLLEMPSSHAKIRVKSAPQKLKFLMTRTIRKSYECSYTFPHINHFM